MGRRSGIEARPLPQVEELLERGGRRCDLAGDQDVDQQAPRDGHAEAQHRRVVVDADGPRRLDAGVEPRCGEVAAGRTAGGDGLEEQPDERPQLGRRHLMPQGAHEVAGIVVDGGEAEEEVALGRLGGFDDGGDEALARPEVVQEHAVAGPDRGGELTEAAVGETVVGDVGHHPIEQGGSGIGDGGFLRHVPYGTLRDMLIEEAKDMDASAERVWAVTVDIERWPDLLPTVTRVERLDQGPLSVGSRARLKQPAQRPTVWTVTRLDAPAVFEWEAVVFGVPTRAMHRIEPLGTGRCRNTLALEMSGRGAGIVGRLFGRRMRAVLRAEHEAFEAAARTGEDSPIQG